MVANCLSALQDIWSAEASTSEEASRESEALISKPVIYYLLNRYVLLLKIEESMGKFNRYYLVVIMLSFI